MSEARSLKDMILASDQVLFGEEASKIAELPSRPIADYVKKARRELMTYKIFVAALKLTCKPADLQAIVDGIRAAGIRNNIPMELRDEDEDDGPDPQSDVDAGEEDLLRDDGHWIAAWHGDPDESELEQQFQKEREEEAGKSPQAIHRGRWAVNRMDDAELTMVRWSRGADGKVKEEPEEEEEGDEYLLYPDISGVLVWHRVTALFKIDLLDLYPYEKGLMLKNRRDGSRLHFIYANVGWDCRFHGGEVGKRHAFELMEFLTTKKFFLGKSHPVVQLRIFGDDDWSSAYRET